MTEQTLSNAMSKTEMPNLFKTLGVESGFKATDLSHVGAILLGWPGTGKTTFAASIKNSLLLYFSPEKAASVIAPQAHRIYVPDWGQWVKVRDTLIAARKAGDCPYNHISIDTGDEWFHVIAGKVITDWNKIRAKSSPPKPPIETIGEVGQKGKGYDLVANIVEQEIRALQTAGLGWLVTGHIREKVITSTMPDGKTVDKTVVRPVLTDSTFQRLFRMSQVRLQIGVVSRTTGPKTITLPSGKTRTTTVQLDEPIREYHLSLKTASTAHEARSYLSQLPERINFPRHGAWGALETANKDAVAQAAKEDSDIRKEKEA